MLKLKRATFLVGRREPVVRRQGNVEDRICVKARGTQNNDRMEWLKNGFQP